MVKDSTTGEFVLRTEQGRKERGRKERQNKVQMNGSNDVAREEAPIWELLNGTCICQHKH